MKAKQDSETFLNAAKAIEGVYSEESEEDLIALDNQEIEWIDTSLAQAADHYPGILSGNYHSYMVQDYDCATQVVSVQEHEN